MVDSWNAVLLVFDARPPPNMRFRSAKAQLRFEQGIFRNALRVELQVDPFFETQLLNVLNITGPRPESKAAQGVLDLFLAGEGLAKLGGWFGTFLFAVGRNAGE